MTNYNRTHQHITQHTYPMTGRVTYLLEGEAQETHPVYSWICENCGAAHAEKLPEECRSCGATALEFWYSSPQATGLPS